MGLLSFFGGVHIEENKHFTSELPVVSGPDAESVFLSMRQHIGAPAKVLVKPNQIVKKGELLGEAVGFISANVHSSVSGKVKKIHQMSISGSNVEVVEIINDFEDDWHEDIKPIEYDDLEGSEIIDHIMKSGIVGMGGAGFPLHAKLKVPNDFEVDTIVINAAECEPYLTNDHRLMLESGSNIIAGAKILMKATGVKRVIIGIENNKPDAIKKLKELTAYEDLIDVAVLKTKYPQGAEKQLIYACTKREVPRGKLPMHVGCIVVNVATVNATYEYFEYGWPLVERICTVTGRGINKPMNVKIKNGTKISDITEFAGGLNENFGKLVGGGPMMGNSIYNLDIPSTKTTSGLLYMSKKEAETLKVGPCIKCSKCVSVCPMFLQPVYICKYVLKDNFEESFKYNPMDCIECGSCSFVCPANRPLLESIRISKRALREQNTRG